MDTFGSGGAVTSDPSSGNDGLLAAAMDGTAIYLGGWERSNWDREWYVEKRLLSDGSLDVAFGTGGALIVSPTAGDQVLKDLTVDGGWLYLAGPDLSTGDNQWRLERRSAADGSLDSSFGSGGLVLSNPSAGNDQPYGLLIDGSGIYVYGYDFFLGILRGRVEKRLK